MFLPLPLNECVIEIILLYKFLYSLGFLLYSTTASDCFIIKLSPALIFWNHPVPHSHVRSTRLYIYLNHYVNLLFFDKVLALICSYLESFRRNVLSSEFCRFHCSINISETKLVWSGTSIFIREFRKEFFPTWVRIDSA